MIRNRPEFHALDLAVLFCGATPVSIYNSSAPEQIEYLVNDCKAKVAIVEDSGFLERFLKVRAALPDARTDRADRTVGARRRRHRPVLGPRRIRTGRSRRRSGDRHARRPRHDHLHVGHDRPAEGRDAQPQQRALDARVGRPDHARPDLRSPTSPASGTCRTCRWRTSWSDCSGTTTSSTSPRSIACCPGDVADGRRSPATCTRTCSSACHGCGRSSTPASTARSPPIAEKKQAFDEAIDAALPIMEKMTRGTATDEETGDLGLPRRGRVQGRPRADRPRPRPRSPSPVPRRSRPRSWPGSGRSGCRSPRDTACPRRWRC